MFHRLAWSDGRGAQLAPGAAAAGPARGGCRDSGHLPASSYTLPSADERLGHQVHALACRPPSPRPYGPGARPVAGRCSSDLAVGLRGLVRGAARGRRAVLVVGPRTRPAPRRSRRAAPRRAGRSAPRPAGRCGPAARRPRPRRACPRSRRPRCRPRRSSRRRRWRPAAPRVRKRSSSARSASVSPGKPTMKLDRTPACGRLGRGSCSSSSRKRSVSPKRRIARSTPGAECWKDRSKYGATFGVEVSTSIRPGRISAGCR